MQTKNTWHTFSRGLYLFLIGLGTLIYLAFVSPASGQSVLRDVREADKVKPLPLVVPYAFYSKTYDSALGVGAGVTGYPQEQARLFGTLFGTSNSSFVLGLGGSEIQIPFFDRVFMDPLFLAGRYTDYRAYVNGNPNFPGENAGANDSSQDNFFKGESTYLRGDVQFWYLLPIGHGRDTVIHTFLLDRGILVSGATGGERWNPLDSGKTYFKVTPFYRHRKLKSPSGGESFNTNGLKLAVEYDNTDFDANPSQGSSQRLAVTRDFGLFDSSDTWTVVEGELSKYFSLGVTPTFRQRVIALNFWTADTPTWKENGSAVSNQPPYYAGATLGGFFRLRAYPEYRFHDRSAIYYSAEYRVIPYWNPLGEINLLKPLEIDWVQLAGFVEVGRVASS